MNRFIGVIKRNFGHLSFFLLFALVFLVGEAVGGVMAAGVSRSALAEFGENLAYSAKLSKGISPEDALESAVSAFVPVGALWLCGFVPKFLSFIISGGVTLYKGVAMGYTIGMIWRIYSTKGFLISLLCILPQYLLLLPLMFAAAAFAVSYLRESRESRKSYFVLLPVFLLISLVGGAVDLTVSGRLMQYLF